MEKRSNDLLWEKTDPSLRKRSLSSDDTESNKKHKVQEYENIAELLSQLEPFSFLIISPPYVYDQIYSQLDTWLKGALNRSFEIDENPFIFEKQNVRIPYFGETVQSQWNILTTALNTRDQLEDNWIKFSTVSQLLSLNEDVKFDFVPLLKEVWWVKYVNEFYSASRFGDNIHFGTFSIILELWYRYIWAMYTKKMYLEQQKLHRCENEISLEEDIDEVIDAEDLGRETSIEEENSSTSEGTDGEESISEDKQAIEESVIPTVVPLFFNQVDIKLKIDTIESAWFEDETWNIRDALDLYCQISCDKMECSTRQKDQYSIQQLVWHFYKTEMIPFLEKMGIKTTGSDKEIWCFHDEVNFQNYLNSITTQSMKNLNNNGNSPSSTFLTLFPSLSINADSRSLTRVLEVSINLENNLKEENKITPEVEFCIDLIEKLDQEKSILNGFLGTNSIDTSAMFLSETVQNNMIRQRELRIKQIDDEIASLRDELHKLTGAIDTVVSRNKKTLPITDLIGTNVDHVTDQVNNCNISPTKKKLSITSLIK